MFRGAERVPAGRLFACLGLIVAVCSTCARSDPEQVHVVSAVNLIATPTAYDEKKVSVLGVLRVSEGGAALFLSADDANYGNLSSGIWLVTEGVHEEQWLESDGHWVGVRGTFDKDARGHFGLFAGTIRGIDRLDTLPEKPGEAAAPTRWPRVSSRRSGGDLAP